MSAPLLGKLENRWWGKRGFSLETKASLWRNDAAGSAFHHELSHNVNGHVA
jgi:hypothetical protein